MHEHGLIEEVIEAALEDLRRSGIGRPRAVQEVALRVGQLEVHSEDSFREAFRSRCQGTLLEGCDVRLEIFPAEIHCTLCGRQSSSTRDLPHTHALPVAECPSCGTVNPLSGGRGVASLKLILSDKQLEEWL